MFAVRVEAFGVAPTVAEVRVPVPGARDALVRIEATGLCRSDAHAWAGGDTTVPLPYTPGHEFVGVVTEVGAEVRRVAVGERVTSPFVCGCGACDDCAAGRSQVCRFQEQPGFSYDGSFAEYLVIRNADFNAVTIPDDIDAEGAALLGCRFATAFRALTDRARVHPGETVAVLGCGGVGLSATLIAVALGARVLAVDVSSVALELARAAGAHDALDTAGLDTDAVVAAIRAACGGRGPDVVIEALGRAQTLEAGVRALASGGRLVQIGLLSADPIVPMGEILARELAVLGSHGMAAADYPRMFDLMRSGGLAPGSLIARRIPLDEAPAAIVDLASAAKPAAGVTMIVAPR